MTLYLVQDTTSGDVFVTSGHRSTLALDCREWSSDGGYSPTPALDLADFCLDFDALTNWPDGYRVLQTLGLPGDDPPDDPPFTNPGRTTDKESHPMSILECLERAMYDIWKELGDVPTGFSLSPKQFRQFAMSLDPIAWTNPDQDRDTIIWQSHVGKFTVTRDWSAQ